MEIENEAENHTYDIIKSNRGGTLLIQDDKYIMNKIRDLVLQYLNAKNTKNLIQISIFAKHIVYILLMQR